MGISVRRRTDGGAATPATGRPGGAGAAYGLPRTGILDASPTYDRACPCNLAGRYPVPWLGRRAGERREPAPGLPRNVSHPGSGKPPLAPAPGRTLTARRPVFSKSSSFKVRFFNVQALQGPGVSGPLSRPFVKRGDYAVPSQSGQRAAGIFCVPFSRKSGNRIPCRRMRTCDTRMAELAPGGRRRLDGVWHLSRDRVRQRSPGHAVPRERWPAGWPVVRAKLPPCLVILEFPCPATASVNCSA